MAIRSRTWRKPEEEGPSAGDLLGEGPPSSRGGTGGDSTGERTPLGVPEDYRVIGRRDPNAFRGMSPNAVENWSARGAGPGAAVERGPRYWEGDEWKPASRGPASIAEMQRMMVLSGYLGASDRFRLGAWDETTRTAYRALLEEANAAGLTAEMMAMQRAETIDVGGGGGEGGSGWTIDPNTGELVPPQFVPPEALPVRLPSRDDMRAVTREVVTDRLGQGWSGEQIEAFIDRYYAYAQSQAQEAYGAEVERQRAAWETGQPTTNVNVELDLTRPDVALDEELRREQPDAYAAGEIADYADAFFTALGGYT